MKIRVTLNIKTSGDDDSTVDLVARPGDTVASVKAKVAGAQLIPFPDQELILDGVVLADDSKLSACGVEEGSCLSFKVKATEAILAQQITELLQARDLSADEVGLLYCYKHGVGIAQAFKLLGFEGKLQDFIGSQKTLTMENGAITIVRDDTALKPFSVVDEIVKILGATDSGTMDVKTLCTKFADKFGTNLSSIIGARPTEFLSKEKTLEVHGRGLFTMVSLQGARKTSEGSSTREGSSTPPGPPGFRAPPGLGAPRVEAHMDGEERRPIDAQQFEELHERIHSPTFNSQVTETLNDIVAALSDAIFLEIDHVVTGGSIGKGTAISGMAAAEVVLFLSGLPTTGHESWQPQLLNSVAGILADDFQAAHGIGSMDVHNGYIKISMQGPCPIAVDLYLSPAFENYQKTVQILGEQNADARKFYTSALAKERTQFVTRQPSAVKQTIRLMKWWREQQEWYGLLSRPSDELLELAAIYSALQTRPADQKEAIANLMSLLSRFDQMRVVWSNNYTKDDVWAPLLSQRPLLMDPANPFVNVADSRTFDPTELMVLARTTHFFW